MLRILISKLKKTLPFAQAPRTHTRAQQINPPFPTPSFPLTTILTTATETDLKRLINPSLTRSKSPPICPGYRFHEEASLCDGLFDTASKILQFFSQNSNLLIFLFAKNLLPDSPSLNYVEFWTYFWTQLASLGILCGQTAHFLAYFFVFFSNP